jgi:ssDNA-binding Zn-finger/Zn-ribbon topoisomerase 1
MPTMKDCPMCGGTMRIRHTKATVQVPGNPRASTRPLTEWVCPECDYFEEAEEEGT